MAFEIPELGIGFKAPFEGDTDQTDFASLLALLEFVDLNRKLFKNRALQIFGGNLRIVKALNSGSIEEAEYRGFLDKALDYRQKYRFSLEWTPARRNPAAFTDDDDEIGLTQQS
ncbi:hypothetical protein JYT16_01010 [Gemmatimonas aurantiaca]|nr:hypothetical protein [Gemmatimonas aurantiaca]